jgi:hypothetical protein
MRKPRLIFGIFALSLASTSCWRQKTQARAFTPPPMRTKRATIPDTGPLPEAPQIETDLAAIVPPPLPELIPEVLEAPKRVTRRPTPPVVAPKPPVIDTPVTPVAPKLGQMLTAEERREYTRTLDESLDRVNRALVALEGKNLTAEQKESLERIRTYQKQAEQARDQGLLTAVSLARRADLLAKDLLERLP